MTETRPPLAPGLHVAATPIGNLGDVSPRLLHALSAADYVLCEDTRVTGKLLRALGLSAALRPYHDHNGAKVRPKILEDLNAGKTIVLVSDAGTPLIADPGFKLVAEARALGVDIRAIPGPSALIAALSIAGVATDRFTFHGFAPAKAKARQDAYHALADRYETHIFYETGPRLAASLSDLTGAIGDVAVIVARELTKRHEEVIEGFSAALSARFAEATPKGEIVLIVPPRSRPAATDQDVDALMHEAIKTMKLGDAAAKVAAETGRKKRDLYQAFIDRKS